MAHSKHCWREGISAFLLLPPTSSKNTHFESFQSCVCVDSLRNRSKIFFSLFFSSTVCCTCFLLSDKQNARKFEEFIPFPSPPVHPPLITHTRITIWWYRSEIFTLTFLRTQFKIQISPSLFSQTWNSFTCVAVLPSCSRCYFTPSYRLPPNTFTTAEFNDPPEFKYCALLLSCILEALPSSSPSEPCSLFSSHWWYEDNIRVR